MNAYIHRTQALIVPATFLAGAAIGDGWRVVRPGEDGYLDWLPFTTLVPREREAWADELVERPPPATS